VYEEEGASSSLFKSQYKSIHQFLIEGGQKSVLKSKFKIFHTKAVIIQVEIRKFLK